MFTGIRSCLTQLLMLGILFGIVSCTTPTTRMDEAQRSVRTKAYLPYEMNDPLEPLNRGIYEVNRGLMTAVISPAGKGYRMVVPSPVRTSIRHFGYNIAYPGRALNQLLQGRVADAGDDSARFLCNTTAGCLGFFDVATKWNMPKHEGNFAQTFQKWGWHGDTYLMLPVVGPSDEVHATGFGFDRMADPMSYSPETRLIGYGVTFNQKTENVDQTLRLIKSNPDSYSTVRTVWTYASKDGVPDWSMHGPQDPSTLQTLAVATLRVKDPDFINMIREAKVKLPNTGKRLPFNYLLQKGKAPLVYIVPGLGSHRLATQSLTLAESLYQKGFSVVTVSGLFHPEFTECASTSHVPGYAAADRQDLLHALTEIDAWMERKHGDHLGVRALVGCSMGGFQTLTLAAHLASAKTAPAIGNNDHCAKPLHFERFIAVNPPVDLHYGMAKLDSYQNAPAKWPAAVRQQRMNNTLHKIAAMMSAPLPAEKAVPIDATESQFLIGLTFRLTLRDAIYASQRRHDMGLLKQPLATWNRKAVYEEIMGISFAEYYKTFVLPYYRNTGVDTSEFERDGDLVRGAPELARLSNIHIITSRNDFLLSPDHVSWLQRTFGPKRLTLLKQGGHMGAFADPAFHELLASKLADLKTK